MAVHSELKPAPLGPTPRGGSPRGGGGAAGKRKAIDEPVPFRASVDVMTEIGLDDEEKRAIVMHVVGDPTENALIKEAISTTKAIGTLSCHWSTSAKAYKVDILGAKVWMTPVIAERILKSILPKCPKTREGLTVNSLDTSAFNDSDTTYNQPCSIIISDGLQWYQARAHAQRRPARARATDSRGCRAEERRRGLHGRDAALRDGRRRRRAPAVHGVPP